MNEFENKTNLETTTGDAKVLDHPTTETADSGEATSAQNDPAQPVPIAAEHLGRDLASPTTNSPLSGAESRDSTNVLNCPIHIVVHLEVFDKTDSQLLGERDVVLQQSLDQVMSRSCLVTPFGGMVKRIALLDRSDIAEWIEAYRPNVLARVTSTIASVTNVAAAVPALLGLKSSISESLVVHYRVSKFYADQDFVASSLKLGTASELAERLDQIQKSRDLVSWTGTIRIGVNVSRLMSDPSVLASVMANPVASGFIARLANPSSEAASPDFGNLDSVVRHALKKN